MCIPGGLLFMWGVVSSFSFVISVAALQKTQFWRFKNGKHTFRGTKKSTSVAFLTTLRATRVSDMASFQQIMP
jgi:hypothetical protein